MLRRSIVELCQADHKGDAETLELWLANKTTENMRRWMTENYLLVAIENEAIVGVAAVRKSGEVILNYVSPDARWRGVSKALMMRLEEWAAAHGIERCTLLSTSTARRFYLSAGYRETGPARVGVGRTVGHPMAKELA